MCQGPLIAHCCASCTKTCSKVVWEMEYSSMPREFLSDSIRSNNSDRSRPCRSMSHNYAGVNISTIEVLCAQLDPSLTLRAILKCAEQLHGEKKFSEHLSLDRVRGHVWQSEPPSCLRRAAAHLLGHAEAQAAIGRLSHHLCI